MVASDNILDSWGWLVRSIPHGFADSLYRYAFYTQAFSKETIPVASKTGEGMHQANGSGGPRRVAPPCYSAAENSNAWDAIRLRQVRGARIVTQVAGCLRQHTSGQRKSGGVDHKIRAPEPPLKHALWW